MASGYPLSRNKSEITQKPFVAQPIMSWLRGLTRPHCPACKGELAFRYQMPDEYQEVSPKYYECSRCCQGYCRTVGGPWVEVSLDEIPRS